MDQKLHKYVADILMGIEAIEQYIFLSIICQH
jgi:hypothetical protein